MPPCPATHMVVMALALPPAVRGGVGVELVDTQPVESKRLPAASLSPRAQPEGCRDSCWERILLTAAAAACPGKLPARIRPAPRPCWRRPEQPPASCCSPRCPAPGRAKQGRPRERHQPPPGRRQGDGQHNVLLPWSRVRDPGALALRQSPAQPRPNRTAHLQARGSGGKPRVPPISCQPWGRAATSPLRLLVC